ncbi:MAG: hypothetical protein LBG97_01975 [Coriobacteriales bacterium]|jgi:hypothetical protein|nr:hypothetical protein [Coriobacteriales bacterium]
MELCYDGALVMPKNCVKVSEQEMEYIEAGWSNQMFYNNLRGLCSRYSGAARQAGLTLGWISAALSYTLAQATVVFGWPVVSVALGLCGVIGGAIAILGVCAAIGYLGNNRVFY